MRLALLFILLSASSFAQSWDITQVAPIPEPVSNNAVCEAFTPAGNFIYSFGGIDTTKSHDGIHLRSYRMNVDTEVWEIIPSLPDTMGKIAAAATRIEDVIYIIGGYHVFPNGHEVSSNKVHRYSVSLNQYLTDGAEIPVPIDDQVQAVWRDSLIYVITGWSNNGNVTDVQIYDVYNDEWSVGTSVPTSGNYRVFGASGTIVGDTIYYFGGAASGSNFPAQRHIRKGVIDPGNPTQINWSTDFFDIDIKGYRTAACVSPLGHIHWLGGSDITYNYNGVAYNGSGGVPTNGQNLFFKPESEFWGVESGLNLPMDLRGVCELSDSIKYLIGGMIDPQQVTDQVVKLSWINTGWNSIPEHSKDLQVYPNPTLGSVQLVADQPIISWQLCDPSGKIVQHKMAANSTTEMIDLSNHGKGFYILQASSERRTYQSVIIKR